MRPRENHSPLIGTAFGLTLAILAAFQIYLFREPARIAADAARDELLAVSAGRQLYAENCAMCHGDDGEGVDGPALSDRRLLAEARDETLFSVIGSGVPGTEMPAWSQVHGGPFTDQDIRQLVAFVRHWEPDAPDRQAEAMAGDPTQGLVIYSSTCFVCHGEVGQGTDRAPALDDAARLARFDDEWYADTIAQGRPARGMPTWGTVLAPEAIRNLVALLRAWERGDTVALPGPEEHLHEAMHVLGHGNLEEARHHLEEAAKVATADQLEVIQSALAAMERGDLPAVNAAISQAEEHDGHGAMPGMDMHDGAVQPGEAEVRAALSDLSLGLTDAAAAKLKVAFVLAQGDLKEAIEHALEDLAAGKAGEASAVLEEALRLGR